LFINTIANWIFGYLFREWSEADFPKLLGFGKSYLIPETTNFDIGEGIVYNKGFKSNYKQRLLYKDFSRFHAPLLERFGFAPTLLDGVCNPVRNVFSPPLSSRRIYGNNSPFTIHHLQLK